MIFNEFTHVFSSISLENDQIKFCETLSPEEKEEYFAVKELLDEFNNNSNQISPKKPEEEKKIENKEIIEEKELGEMNISENKSEESFMERNSSEREEDRLFIHLKDKIFKIKTKNFLLMRE